MWNSSAPAVPSWTTEARRALVRGAARDLEDASPQEVLRWGIDTFGDKFCIAASMETAVLIDMVARIRAGVAVLFVDTGYHFPETLLARDAVATRYDVELITLTPDRTVAEQDRALGPRLFQADPDRCCALRKLAPLEQGLAEYDAWASGARRDETPNRRRLPVVQWDAGRGKVKLNPLASWTQEQLRCYVEEHDVVVHPLLHVGYPSIGCAPCTSPVEPGDDPRSGRWRGFTKTECGLHL